MANKILMPKLSPTMEEGQISRWIKAEGDAIEPNETIAEVDTDKATMEMTSLEGGTLLKILVPAGNNAKLGQTIGVIGNPGEDISALLAEVSTNGSAAAAPAPAPKAEIPAVMPEAITPAEDPKSKIQNPKSDGSRLLVSPIAARMATENGIDLRSIVGSGPQGRIIKRDIEAAITGGSKAHPQTAISTPKSVAGFRDENTSKMRQVIAQRLGESIGPIPTFYLTVEIEMDNALELRKQINATLSEDDKISVNDIIVKVAAASLMKHPFVNASYRDTSIRFYDQADIGVAVAVDEGLITPVVRGANHKGFAEIAREVRELAGRARERKLLPEEYTGATFSISNLGMFGIKEFTAIINPPEAAILAVGGASPTPVVRNGEVVVRNIMNVTMSCDHRVIDGATGAKFLQTFKQLLENPVLMLV
ncbi:MAG: pyruvate dehydrogenase complex dihydrolipoamide acetyltransferase [Acidobacteria bacterium]|nr:pyruvate dehydrogenase complex dihydrolipoamide acetyltransferase [Acidobacteriota bacterium]